MDRVAAGEGLAERWGGYLALPWRCAMDALTAARAVRRSPSSMHGGTTSISTWAWTLRGRGRTTRR